jgi:hypothetical protein
VDIFCSLQGSFALVLARTIRGVIRITGAFVPGNLGIGAKRACRLDATSVTAAVRSKAANAETTSVLCLCTNFEMRYANAVGRAFIGRWRKLFSMSSENSSTDP